MSEFDSDRDILGPLQQSLQEACRLPKDSPEFQRCFGRILRLLPQAKSLWGPSNGMVPIDKASLDAQVLTLLENLISAACAHRLGTLARQFYVNRIIQLMQASDKLWQAAGVSRDQYDEALQRTWIWFGQNLEKYDRTRANPFTWLNNRLRYKILDVQREETESLRQAAMMYPIDEGDESNPIEQLPSPPDVPTILEDVLDWLEIERSQLEKIYPSSYPHVTAYLLLKRRLPPIEQSWESLAAELRAKRPSIVAFYQRKCFPLLLEFGRSQGYFDDRP